LVSKSNDGAWILTPTSGVEAGDVDIASGYCYFVDIRSSLQRPNKPPEADLRRGAATASASQPPSVTGFALKLNTQI
jgi:hypothetical protein